MTGLDTKGHYHFILSCVTDFIRFLLDPAATVTFPIKPYISHVNVSSACLLKPSNKVYILLKPLSMQLAFSQPANTGTHSTLLFAFLMLHVSCNMKRTLPTYKYLMRTVIHCVAFCRTKTVRAYNLNPPCPTKLGDGI